MNSAQGLHSDGEWVAPQDCPHIAARLFFSERGRHDARQAFGMLTGQQAKLNAANLYRTHEISDATLNTWRLEDGGREVDAKTPGGMIEAGACCAWLWSARGETGATKLGEAQKQGELAV